MPQLPVPTSLPPGFVRTTLADYVIARRDHRGRDEPPEETFGGSHRSMSSNTILPIARLASAFARMADPKALTPGTVTVLRTSSTLGLPTPPAARHVFRALQAALGLERRWPAEVIDATDAASSSNRTWPQHVESVLEEGMLRGAAVFLMVKPDLAIPPSVASVTSGAQLILPPVTGSMVATMLEACGAVPSPDFSELGEADPSAHADYSNLSSMQFAHAWNGETAGGVFARLRAVSASEDQAARLDMRDSTLPSTGPTLRNLHGLGEARHPLERTVADVLDWQAGALAWSDVNGSFLLHGPPGVGKTMTAKALATEIGGSLIDLSYGTTQAAGHLGRMLAALDDGVRQAREAAPCVVLVDEADDLSDRGDESDHHGAGYRRAVVNGYLTRLSALSEIPGCIVVLASNYPERLDPALVRAGRCDRHIRLGLPDAAALGAILDDALRGKSATGIRETAAWRDVVECLVGGTGADAALVARETIAIARERVRRGGGRADVSEEDLRRAVAHSSRAQTLREEDLYRMAIHEAAHLVVGHVLDCPPATRAWIGPRGAGVEAPRLRVHTLPTAEAELTNLMAGRAAEVVLCGTVSSGSGDGPASDLAEATALASRVVSEWQLAEPDAPVAWCPANRSNGASLMRMGDILRQAYARADRIVRTHASEVERIASVLVAERDLNASRIGDLLETITPVGAIPVALVH